MQNKNCIKFRFKPTYEGISNRATQTDVFRPFPSARTKKRAAAGRHKTSAISSWRKHGPNMRQEYVYADASTRPFVSGWAAALSLLI
jgi:hypothetical protein